MKITTLSTIFFLTFITNVSCQNHDKISILENKEISNFFEFYNNLHVKKIQIFKIQLFVHENRSYAWKIKKKYEELFPENKASFYYESPYFKVSSELFLKRSDAERKKDSLKENFPDCFIIREKVNLNDYY